MMMIVKVMDEPKGMPSLSLDDADMREDLDPHNSLHLSFFDPTHSFVILQRNNLLVRTSRSFSYFSSTIDIIRSTPFTTPVRERRV